MKGKGINKKGGGMRKMRLGLIYFCEYCGKRFTASYNLKKHLRSHTGERPYACQFCDARFTQTTGLRNHVASKHAPPDTMYTCDYCAKEFPIKDRLKIHLRIHTGEKPYSCKLCEKTFARHGQLSSHSKSHSGQKPFSCSLCLAGFCSRTNLLNHLKRHEGTLDYFCDVCGRGFVRRDGLMKHLNFHADVKTSHCHVCGKKYRGHLSQHLRTHVNDRPHACSHCHMKFVQKSQLTVHERVHSGIRPYRCRVCHAAFAHSTALKMHARRHTGERPFECHACPKAFNQLPHLKKHVLTIHNSDKPYMCSGCRALFKSKSSLEQHTDRCKLSISVKRDRGESATMSISRMRLLLACLFQKISSQEKLRALGYGKMLIDRVLCASIESSGRKPCLEESLDDLTKLKKNIEILLDWTIPKVYMERFRREQRTVEDLLEELTS